MAYQRSTLGQNLDAQMKELRQDIALEAGLTDTRAVNSGGDYFYEHYFQPSELVGTNRTVFTHSDKTAEELSDKIYGPAPTPRSWPPNDTVLTSRADWTH